MLVENPTYTIPRSPNHITADGSYSLDFSTPSNTNYLTIFRTVGFSGTYTISFWIRPHSVPTTGQLVAPVLSIASATGPSPDYPWIGFYGNGGTTTMRFCVKQGLNDAITCLDSANTSWTVDSSFYHIVFGQYPTPSTTEPYQYTLWMQVNAGTRATVTTTYPGVPALGDLRVGATQGNATYYLDDLGVWAWTWSPGDVSAMYNVGAGRAYPFNF